MTVGELIKALADYCPDTPLAIVDGNLLTSPLYEVYYGDQYPQDVAHMDDGRGGDPETLYLQGE